MNVDNERILEGLEKFAIDLPYKKFPQKEVLSATTDIADCGQCWQIMAQELYETLDMSQDDVSDIIELIFNETVSGCSADEIFDTILLCEKETGKKVLMYDWINIWQVVLEGIMTLGLPMLHGYSRMEYEKITGKNAFETDVFAADIEREEITQDTSLKDMPVKIQEEIYRAFYENRESDRPKALEKIRKGLSVENAELECLTALSYMGTGKYNKANTMFAAIADRTEDESVEALIDMVGEQVAGISDYYMNRVEEWDPFAGIEMDMPYQRESKKIGRNDPCPCGSGKKYKKCCGK